MGSQRLVGLIAGLLMSSSLLATDISSTQAPDWNALTVEQKRALAPLAREWPGMSDSRRHKWVSIADRFNTYTPEEQVRLQERMRNWAVLTPEQRERARDRYKALQKIPADQRETLKDKWRAYQELPPDEKKRLSESVSRSIPRRPGTTKKAVIAPPRPIASGSRGMAVAKETPTVPSAAQPVVAPPAALPATSTTEPAPVASPKP
ncbi:MAG: DUF3106 domain-containing protein [Zoogloea sp.]|nr:DUF3106 domain-containing protein [Zoogloea sp.]